jgi:hypothetical protein
MAARNVITVTIERRLVTRGRTAAVAALGGQVSPRLNIADELVPGLLAQLQVLRGRLDETDLRGLSQIFLGLSERFTTEAISATSARLTPPGRRPRARG